MEKLYTERLNRYVTAMRHGMPDRVPIRPFVAEFTAKYAGYTCQEVTHDYEKAFAAARLCAKDFDWDAIVPNMVYVWTGLTQAIGMRYYGVPGVDVPADTGFQYLEPPEGGEYMKASEYDALIEDPTGFLYNIWLPRVSSDVRARGHRTSYRNNLSFVKGGMAMLQYFYAFGTQIARMRAESGTVSAISGIFKAPFDILADKLRGYVGLTLDMQKQPKKVLAACEALMPHLYHVARTTADPQGLVPIGYWMHRGCVPFIRPEWFESHYWPTVRPIIETLWSEGKQTLFYAEGSWDAHLDSFAELPEGSIVYHVDQGDLFQAHQKLGHKFCLSGGIPNFLLSYRPPKEVRAWCKKVIDGVARNGGYILDAGAIMQNDTRAENLRAMTEFAREYGAYSTGHAGGTVPKAIVPPLPRAGSNGHGLRAGRPSKIPPGVCVPWGEKRRELPGICGDEAILRNIWESVDGLGNVYIWQCLLSF
ncbi:MAG: hypothetical protein HYU36_19385 [Planctomycetes bacterium]|nr:hypothetical protein [Planctomycetota bacterium]